jgi:Spy/CpxP family protein refolding chaperone
MFSNGQILELLKEHCEARQAIVALRQRLRKEQERVAALEDSFALRELAIAEQNVKNFEEIIKNGTTDHTPSK